MCRRCWRGQAYCSEECRGLGKRRVHREAQRRFRQRRIRFGRNRQTPKGKRAHRQGENRRRHGWSKKREKKMDDPSSKGLTGGVIRFLVYVSLFIFYLRAEWDRARRCHFCGVKGQIVDGFPRRE